MDNMDRRTALTAIGGLLTASGGCLSSAQNALSGSQEIDLETSIGEIAATSPPEQESPLPVAVAGGADADVTVAVFEDYACPHCATYGTEVFPQLASEYLESEEIRYEYYDYPVPVEEPVSIEAPHAARQVQQEAGPQAFFEFQERLLQNQELLELPRYSEFAEGLSVEPDNITEAAQKRDYEGTVERDNRFAQENGVEGTPMVFVNGEKLNWSEISYAPLQDAIEAER